MTTVLPQIISSLQYWLQWLMRRITLLLKKQIFAQLIKNLTCRFTKRHFIISSPDPVNCIYLSASNPQTQNCLVTIQLDTTLRSTPVYTGDYLPFKVSFIKVCMHFLYPDQCANAFLYYASWLYINHQLLCTDYYLFIKY